VAQHRRVVLVAALLDVAGGERHDVPHPRLPRGGEEGAGAVPGALGFEPGKADQSPRRLW
jgi:hypothetical protein